MKLQLDLIESRLQALIEEWIIPTNRDNFQARMAHQLVDAMQTHLVMDDSNRAVAPDRYIICLHPEILLNLKNQQDLADHLSTCIQQTAHEAGITFLNVPVLEFKSTSSTAEGEISVTIGNDPVSSGKTAIFQTVSDAPPLEPGGRNAFLVVNGSEFFPLPLSVVNLGRKSDNHIVLKDVRVSRAHAQIRFIRGQYVLLDLNSTGGTSVNGQRINQYTLKPGDVISLAGVSIIYGEEPATDDPPVSDDSPDHTRSMRPPTSGTPPE